MLCVKFDGDLEQVADLDAEIRIVEEVFREARQKGIHGVFQHSPGTFFFELSL